MRCRLRGIVGGPLDLPLAIERGLARLYRAPAQTSAAYRWLALVTGG